MDTCLVNVFVKWLYTQNLPPTKCSWFINPDDNGDEEDEDNNEESDEDDDEGSNSGEPDVSHQQFDLLRVKVYVFGDGFLAQGFRHAVLHDIVNFQVDTRSVFYYSAVKYAFTNLLSDNILLQLMVHVQCSFWGTRSDTKSNGEIKQRDHLPKAFLTRVMICYCEILENGLLKEVAHCDYHEHTTEEEREICKKTQRSTED